MDKVRAIKIQPNSNIEFIEISSVDGWNEIRKHVGNGENATLDRVHLSQQAYELTMYVDDEGLLKELPLNFYLEFNSPIYPLQAIVGTVCFARGKIIDDDIVYENLTDRDISYIRYLVERGKKISAKLSQF